MIGNGAPIARLFRVTQRYRQATALDNVTLTLPAGRLVGLIGPDGVGKSSLLAILRPAPAGSSRGRSGSSTATWPMRSTAPPSVRASPICRRAGRNLYPDLSIRENIEYFGRLFGQSAAERRWRIADLLEATGLAPFAGRPAKNLSGGICQKLGLCCSLIHDPDLLILDEPTTGVDPLSRRQFWDLIERIRSRRSGMSVVVATAYMEEAERFDWLVAMTDGRVAAAASPAELKRQTGENTIEKAFIALLPERQRAGHRALTIPPRRLVDAEPVIAARGLTRRFGGFTAVDHVSFTIERGEIFGFVGSNGCGKTTTMKMLTGLLPASDGEALLFGRPLDARDPQARSRVGYMSQSFSLYGELTIRQNLDLHAHLFHLPEPKAKRRIAELVDRFGLAEHLDQYAEALPLGIRQRLSLAVAIVHEPGMRILDEPTSGVDPLARDRFWGLLIDLSRKEGVKIFVSTHFMNEAERCDRISLMDSGRVLATDTPAGLVGACGAYSLEARRQPKIQLDVDATAMVQAGLGAEYAQQIIMTEIDDFLSRAAGTAAPPVDLVLRIAFNPNVESGWFTAIMGIINSVTMLAIVLTGAALVREREHGTMDHLLIMPLTPFEIAMAKIWANGLVIVVAVALSLYFVVRGLLHIPIAGSIPLFLVGVAVYLFFATAVGLLLGTIARSMPQLGLLYLLVYLPLAMLSGSNTPLESMPPWLATIAQVSPTLHFVSFVQAILYRGAGISVVWRQFALTAAIGAFVLLLVLVRFRKVAA